MFLSPKRHQGKKREQEDPRLSAAYNILQNVANAPKDECSTFGKHVATKLKKFDDRVRSVVMHLMNNIIFDAEMGKYNNYGHSSVQTPPPYAQEPSAYVHTLSPSSTYSAHSIQSQGLSNSQFSDSQSSLTPLQNDVHSFDDANNT